MKKMENFLTLNWVWILIILIGLAAVIYAVTQLKKPVETPVVVPTTESVDFTNDSIAGTPVMVNNPHADIFRAAAKAAIDQKINPWIYLSENWDKANEMNGVDLALINFITNEAHQVIPDSSTVSLSIRDYSNPNSVVMEYRDPAKDSIMVTTGHDPEPVLYASFVNKAESKTFKLICANGLVRDLGGKTTDFNHDYVIKKGDNFIALTKSTPVQAYGFALKNKRMVSCVVKGITFSNSNQVSRKRVFADYKKLKVAKFIVHLKPGDILRKQNGEWIYIKQ